ncbi:MAG: response regulator [Chitinivibrionales bacterium]|nr:response regulator [Chitinivibrionales bacterium]MBD3395123.1 response regulator [Chitinivibrionales bacterium]
MLSVTADGPCRRSGRGYVNASEHMVKQSAHVLVVEDEEEVAALIAETLHRAGHRTDIRLTGADALAYMREHDVDLVLMDVMLRDADGVSVALQMREELGADRFVPIILVSGLDAEADKLRGLAYADDYITKPFPHDELMARVRAMLRIRQLQQQLLAGRNRYRFLYQGMPELCVSLDRKGRIWDCNAAFLQACGCGRDSVAGRNLVDFFMPGDHDAVRAYCDGVEEGHARSQQVMFRPVVPGHGESSRRVALRGVKLPADDEGPSLLLVMRDAPRPDQHEEERRIARRQLYRSAQMVSIGTLAAGVAHELNNPLAAVLGFSDALLHRLDSDGAVDAAELRQYLGIIKSESLRCRDILDNLHRFSRDREPQILDMSLLDCIRSACSLIGARASKKRMTIRNRITADITVKADPQRMGQVFLNVLANAIDFCPEGSTVTIDLAPPAPNARFAGVQIADNGPGIEPDVLPRVFDPFFTTKEVGKGIGVGLALCHKAMEECEGSIDITSGKDGGTTVLIEVPLGGPLK